MKREGIGIRLTAFIAVYHLQGLDSDFCMNQIFLVWRYFQCRQFKNCTFMNSLEFEFLL